MSHLKVNKHICDGFAQAWLNLHIGEVDSTDLIDIAVGFDVWKETWRNCDRVTLEDKILSAVRRVDKSVDLYYVVKTRRKPLVDVDVSQGVGGW